jgi:hypothetical protein
MAYNDEHVGAANYFPAIERYKMENACKTRSKKFNSEHPEIVDFLNENGTTLDQNFVDKMYSAWLEYGGLTANQVKAVEKIIAKKAERKAKFKEQNALSRHTGVVGGREQFTCVVFGTAYYETDYGTTYVKIMKQGDDVIIWKGSGAMASAEKGDTINFWAKVKEHGLRDGTEQTIVQRPTKVMIDSNSH